MRLIDPELDAFVSPVVSLPSRASFDTQTQDTTSATLLTLEPEIDTSGYFRVDVVGVTRDAEDTICKSVYVAYRNSINSGLAILNTSEKYSYIDTDLSGGTLSFAVSSGKIVASFSGVDMVINWRVSVDLLHRDFITILP
jgi:hypothetical protein